jgi:hypothetical protein
MVKLSIIIPYQNQCDVQAVKSSLRSISGIQGVEVIVVDEHGSQEVLKVCKNMNTKIIQCNNTNRAKRLNIGAKQAMGELLLLHHPRNVVSKQSLQYLLKQTDLQWGGFKHQFNHSGLFYALSSWYSNYVRLKGWGTTYLDHCIVVRRDLFNKVGGIPAIDIFEDTAFSKKLRTYTRPVLIPFTSTTSPVRFTTNGFLYQWMLNQIMKLGYTFGLKEKQLNSLYEKGLWLNNKKY